MPSRPVPVCFRPAAGLVLLGLGFLAAACGSGREPRRVEDDGVEYVQNRSRPLRGDPMPDPEPARGLLILEGGAGAIPAWSAARDVRAAQGGTWAVLGMHRNEITWFDRSGAPSARMDLGDPALGLTCPIGLSFFPSGGVCIDMALRRAVVFTASGMRRNAFDLSPGVPVDVGLYRDADLWVLMTSRTVDGREQSTQIRRYDLTGRSRPIAGADSLLLDRRRTEEITTPLPTSLAVGRDGTLWAAALDYTIHQISPDGHHRIITRSPRESRVPDWLLEEKRRLMRLRVSSQRTSVPIMEVAGISALLALTDGGCLVQTGEWHPELLDARYNSRQNVIVFDRFDETGNYLCRYAVELPLPRTCITMTDAADGTLYGVAVPALGEGAVAIVKFDLPPG